jgi:alkylhydroperoxidase family enzyme
MARIPLIEPEKAAPEIRVLYDEIREAGMSIFNVMKMFANNANCLAALVNFLHALYGENSKLNPRLRELAYLRASQLNSCMNSDPRRARSERRNQR